MDRLRGRLEAPFDARARAACRASAGEAMRARWRQYRSIWAFEEGGACRRDTILRHFGDRSAPVPSVPCCDVCAPEVVPVAPVGGLAVLGANGAGPGSGVSGERGGFPDGSGPPGRQGALDAAILAVVSAAAPPVGRTRAVEILRGGRSQAVRRHAYDGLPLYGAFGDLSAGDVLARVDALLAAGRLLSTGGPYPKLRVPEARAA